MFSGGQLILTLQPLDLYLNNASCLNISNRMGFFVPTKYVFIAPSAGTENRKNLKACMIPLTFS